MKKSYLIALCLAAALLVCGLPSLVLGDDYHPVTVSSSCSPKSISSPQKVTVTIVVTNIADGNVSVPVALYDPSKNAVSFQGGVTSIGQSQKATYVGTYNVTKEDLDKGKFNFYVKYNIFKNDTSVPTAESYTRTLSIPISKGKASTASKLTTEHKISPSSASKGQTVTLTYTITNTGSNAVTNVQITNTSLTKDKINISRIDAGDKVTKTFQYTMGSKSIKSKPKVTYRNEGSDKVLTLNTIPSKTIELEKGGVIVNLKAKDKSEVKPGEKVELTCTITNNSNVSYKDVKISDPLLGDIATGIELKANTGKHTETKTVTVNETADYSFLVEGASESGKELSISSNPVHLVAIDMTKQLQLEIIAQAQSTEIYEEPSEVVFAVTVKNVGVAEGKDLLLKHGKTTIAKIPSLPSGEEQTFVKALLVSMGGTFRFDVSGVNEQGTTQEIEGNEVKVPYLMPTEPPPPPTPEPTDAPFAEATDEPVVAGTTGENQGGNTGMLLLWGLAGLLLLALVVVLVFILLGRRRESSAAPRGEAVVDSIQRGARRDYGSQHRPAHAQPRTGRGTAPRERPVAADFDTEEFDNDYDPAYSAYDTDAYDADAHDANAPLSSSASLHDLASKYGRPEPEERPKPARGSAARDAERTGSTADDYLARMREQRPPREARTPGETTDVYRRRRARNADA